MNTPRHTNQSGLTLIELLAIVALIAILAALIFPVVRGMGDRAKTVNCAAAMRGFGTAALLYRAEHNGYLPPGELVPPSRLGDLVPISPVSSKVKSELLQGGYLEEIPCCPAMRLSAKGVADLKNKTEKNRLKEIGSYSINLYLTQTKIDALPGPYWGGGDYPGASRMAFISETHAFGVADSLSHAGFALNGADWVGLHVAPRDHGNKRLNFMFLDGHIELLAPKVKDDGSYDWTEIFEKNGKNGRHITFRSAFEHDAH